MCGQEGLNARDEDAGGVVAVAGSDGDELISPFPSALQRHGLAFLFKIGKGEGVEIIGGDVPALQFEIAEIHVGLWEISNESHTHMRAQGKVNERERG